MPRKTEQPSAIQVPGILDFARAFKAAARAGGFYPPGHPAIGGTLEAVHRAERALTDQGALCLTILPDRFLAGGVPMDGADRLVAEFAGILHRHGVGALLLNGRATPDSWRALFTLLAQSPDAVRVAGGVQRQWKTLRQSGPGVLEVDFKELLLGRVGGDFSELAAVIGHYLETASVGRSLASDVVTNLTRALDRAPDDEQAVEALIGELRTAAHLVRVLQPEQFDEAFKQAATVAARLTEGVMAGLLAARGTTPAMLGPLDVVAAFLERISDESAAEFLAGALLTAGHASAPLTDALIHIVPDPVRRKAVTQSAYRTLSQNAVEVGFLERWTEIEQQLESYADRQFVPDVYAGELQSARRRSASARRTFDDPDDRIAAWVDSVDDGAIRGLDLSLLTDLSRLENDAFRWREVLAILRAHIIDAAEDGDWESARVAADAVARVAGDASDALRSPPALDVLQECARNWIGEEALARLVEGDVAHVEPCARLLGALGPACIPGLVRRWSGDSHEPARQRVESVVVALGQPGRDALLRLLSAGDADVQCATIQLLGRASGHEHFPAMERLLANPSVRIQREALAALAAAQSEQGHELAARGISRADATQMGSLVELLNSLGPDRAIPVLCHLVRMLDPGQVPLPIWHAVIDGLKRGRLAPGADGLARRFETPLWRSPVQTLRIRSAARRAQTVRGEPAADALRGVSLVGGRRS